MVNEKIVVSVYKREIVKNINFKEQDEFHLGYIITIKTNIHIIEKYVYNVIK